ncbi:MAG: DUF4012 domain-containing protein [Microbacterium sp.]
MARSTARRRRWPRITAWSICGVFVVVILCGVIFALQAKSVASDLMAAKDELSAVVDDVQAGDSEKIAERADDVHELTERANRTVSNPLWSIASAVPVVGKNVDAVRLATQATYALVDGALQPGLTILDSLSLDNASVTEGGIDLAPLRDAEKSLPQITEAFEVANDKVGDIDRERILPVVDDAVGSLIEIIEASTPTVQVVEKYLPTLLSVAGADDPRRYMLVFQNNAEIRSGGGLPAATAIVDVDNGKADLAEQTSTYSFRRDTKVIDPPDEMEQLYEEDTFTGFGNFTRTPNFPTTAEMFDSLWNLTTDEHLDGVITIDPVVLAHMLEVTGPVTAKDGTELTADNAVQTLLYDTYIRLSGDAQDAFFGDVASRVFDKISDGGWDPVEMLDQLVRSVDEQRMHMWFSREDEQAMVVDLGLDGQLTTTNDEGTEVGIFLNDYSASKLTYFLESDIQVTCDADAGTMTTSITVANNVPIGELTNYQLGIRNRRYGIPRESFILDVMFFAPPGSQIVGSDPIPDDESITRTGVEDERNVQSNRYFIASGDEKTMSFTSTIPSDEQGPLSVRYSPTVTDTPIQVGPSCSSVFPEK